MNINPVFFDHFGVLVFLFIVWYAYFDLKDQNNSKASWIKWILLTIGVLGFLVDGVILLDYYFNW